MQNRKPDRFLYAQLIGILVIPLLLTTTYAVSDKEISLFGVTLQKSSIGKSFAEQNKIPDITIADTLTNRQEDILTTDTTSQRILFFGDSMVEGLNRRMRQYASLNKHKLLSVIWYSSSTKIWAQSDTLSHYLHRFRPTYILICLGSNELSVQDLDKRDSYIQTIMGQIRNTPFLWIGPPDWKQETGIGNLIEQHTGQGRYFLSRKLSFERKEDGAHPTLASASEWMDSIAMWITNRSSHPIQMKMPGKDMSRQGETIILAPQR